MPWVTAEALRRLFSNLLNQRLQYIQSGDLQQAFPLWRLGLVVVWGRAEDLLSLVFCGRGYTCISERVTGNGPLLIVRGISDGLLDLVRSQNAKIREFYVSRDELLQSRRYEHWN